MNPYGTRTTKRTVYEEVPPFIAAPTFQGPKPGYTFTNGALGPGYYTDNKPELAAYVAEEKEESGGDALLAAVAIGAAAAAGSPEAQMKMAAGGCCVLS